ncbi:MAG: chemotaxis protein CheA [Pirellulales bacterium]|nr:chemotaxis protein CheA [Pirellulales bacterium]
MPPSATNADAPSRPLAGPRNDWQNASKYLSMFIDEGQRTLDEITDALLAWEEGGRGGGARQLLVAAHRLKGSAASIGLERVAKLAHLTEDLVQKAIDEGGEATPEISDAMLSFADGLRKFIERLRLGQTDDSPLEALAERLTAAATTVQRTRIDDELHRSAAAAVREDQRDSTLVGKVVFEPHLALVGLKARLLYEKLSNLGAVRFFQPPVEGIEELDELGDVCFGVVTVRPVEAVRRHVRVAGIKRMAIEPLDARKNRAIAAEPAAKTTLAGKPAETIRVEVERLDRLMNRAGGLSLSKSRLKRIAGELKQAAAGNREVEAVVARLDDAVHSLDRVGDEIQQGMMDLRMAPIGPLLTRFHRVVRDVARAGGKEIRLVIRGENTELDKRMIDELGDPLIHLVRNAADHGIELPGQRAAAQKNPQGTIAIEARHRGGSVVVMLADDGRGIDVERLVEKAVEKGLVAADAAAEMDRREKLRLVWLPGLSTAENVSDLSGRGMGMDIVRAKIEQLNGAVELESKPGRGTTVEIKLPLTLAVLPSLMVEIENEPVAIPMESVAEVVGVERRDATDVLGRPTVVVRDRVIAIVSLADLFGRAAASPPPHVSQTQTIVVFGCGGRRIGLAVDRVFGEEDVLVKPLDANWRNVAGIAGASILGDGRVCLILDPTVLIEDKSQTNFDPINNRENAP